MDELSPVFAKAIAPATESPFRWLRHEIDRLFDDFGRPARSAFKFGGDLVPLDLEETEDGYRLTAELPGMKDEDVEVTLADHVLTISGEKAQEEEKREGGVLMSERRFGSFSRSVRLPEDADPDKLEARIKKGVLTVTIEKDEAAADRVRRIEVKKD